MIREEGETIANGPGGVLASPETFEAVKKTKVKALCQHTSKAGRHLNKFSQVRCLGPEHEEAWCQRESHSELMHYERIPVKIVGTNNTDWPRTGLSYVLMAIE